MSKLKGKIFCGLSKLPRGKRYGNMIECGKIGQVRRWGLLKIDSRTAGVIIGHNQETRNLKKERDDLLKKTAQLAAQITKLRKEKADVQNQIERGEQPFRTLQIPKGLSKKKEEEWRASHQNIERKRLTNKKEAHSIIAQINKEIDKKVSDKNSIYPRIDKIKEIMENR